MRSSYSSIRAAAVAGRWSLAAGILILGFTASPARATEGGGSVYPSGVETVVPGLIPAPGGSLFAEFDDFFQANGLVDGHGHQVMPGFHLRVSAFAVKFVHNWGVHVLGGTLVSYVGAPVLYEHVDGPGFRGDNTGLSNLIVQPLAVSYDKGAWHWWYGADMYTPGLTYNKNALVNIGQHNWGAAPTSAFSWLPSHSTEVSSKVQYIVNATDPATNYRSGNEFIWEYDGMHNVAKKVAVGVNGFNYFQTTSDLRNGLVVAGGNRGRDLAIGPEVRIHVGREVLAFKYQRDTLVENRPVGNQFWFQFGVPIGGHE